MKDIVFKVLIYFQKDCQLVDLLFPNFPMVLLDFLLVVHLMVLLELLMEEYLVCPTFLDRLVVAFFMVILILDVEVDPYIMDVREVGPILVVLDSIPFITF